jgi:integrase
MAKLTAVKVRNATHPGTHKGPAMLPDGEGLYLQITPGGSKSWVYRYTRHHKARMMGLGVFGEDDGAVTLAAARGLAGKARAALAEGLDPLDAKREAAAAEAAKRAAAVVAAITFRTAATGYVDAHKAGWKNEKHSAQWSSTLATYAFPVFGDRPVAEIDADAVELVLKPLWLRVPETASRLRGRIEAVLDYARARGWRTGDNPARWRESMKHRLPNVSKVKRTSHHPALPWQQIGAFMAELGTKQGMAAKALAFAILTAARSGEVRGAKWGEIDLEAATWTVPGERMKAGKDHRVPLSKRSLAILTELHPRSTGPASLVFPSTVRTKPLSDMALSMLVRGMNEGEAGAPPTWHDARGEAVVPHGFRSTFRDWCEEATSTPHAVCEAALAHTVADKVEAAYRRTDLFERRTALMANWAEQCARKPANVVKLPARATAAAPG